jgi:nitroreductase
MLTEAPVAILVCGDPRKERHPDLWPQDCAAATENLLLAAHGQGLGSVWLGLHPREDRQHKMRALLGIPDHIIPFALVPLGWPAESPADPDRYLEERIRVNRW